MVVVVVDKKDIDFKWGVSVKLCLVYNNYFMLLLLFIMILNYYFMMY